MDENQKEFIRRFKELYYKIGSISCPAFSNEPVYFNEQGFEHMLMKEGKLRKIPDQKRKIYLARKAPDILSVSTEFSKYTKTVRLYGKYNLISTAEFWEVARNQGGRMIIVVVRKINNGPLHFFSVKDRKSKV